VFRSFRTLFLFLTTFLASKRSESASALPGSWEYLGKKCMINVGALSFVTTHSRSLERKYHNRGDKRHWHHTCYLVLQKPEGMRSFETQLGPGSKKGISMDTRPDTLSGWTTIKTWCQHQSITFTYVHKIKMKVLGIIFLFRYLFLKYFPSYKAFNNTGYPTFKGKFVVDSCMHALQSFLFSLPLLCEKLLQQCWNWCMLDTSIT
jgi:hypothetical protein